MRFRSTATPTPASEQPETPAAGFHPLDILGEEMLGLWVGENDVNFVRGYRLNDTGETRPVPGWLQGSESTVAGSPAPDQEELLELMNQAIRMMASAQEIYYSRAYTYTTLVDSLSFEQPEGIEIDFTQANARGWAAVFTHSAIDRVCGLAYGFGIPPGWPPGRITCGPPSAPSLSQGR